MSIWESWWGDPEASVTLVIAFITGLYAVYQLRTYRKEKQRQILEGMAGSFSNSRDQRTVMLRDSPPLMAMAYEALNRALDAEPAIVPTDLGSRGNLVGGASTLDRLESERESWSRPGVGISFTSAREILGCEYKLRALLWCVEMIRDESENSPVLTEHRQAARKAISSLNDFATDYENGTYPVRTLFGVNHIGIANAVKALEPYIWSWGLEGRWGRRVIRLGISAQHFNDVTPVHRSTSIVWNNSYSGSDAPKKMIVHPRITETGVFGHETFSKESVVVPRLLPYLRLYLRSWYWTVVGWIGPRPRSRLWFLSYGGLRRRRHMKAEADLTSILRHMIQHRPNQALSFGWSVESIRIEMEELASPTIARPWQRSWWYRDTTKTPAPGSIG